MKFSDERLAHFVLGERIPDDEFQELISDPDALDRFVGLSRVDEKLRSLASESQSPRSTSVRGLSNPLLLQGAAAALALGVEWYLSFRRRNYAVGWTDQWVSAQRNVLLWGLGLAAALAALTWVVWRKGGLARRRLMFIGLIGFVVASVGLWAFAARQHAERSRAVHELLAEHRWCTYEPPGYDPNRKNYPTEAEMRSQLAVIATGFKGIVTFGSTGSLREIPRLAKDAGIDAVIMGIGAWSKDEVAPDEDAALEAEVAGAIAVNRWVDAYCVGHNVSTRVPLSRLEELIARLRRETDKPVTTTLPLTYYLGERGRDFRRLGDFLFPDVLLPFHRGTTPDVAMEHVRAVLRDVQTLPADRPVLLKMLNYPSSGGPGLSPENQEAFYRDLVLNVFLPPGVSLSVFNSHDLPWKSGSAWDPAEANVGIIDAENRKKPAFRVLDRLWRLRRIR